MLVMCCKSCGLRKYETEFYRAAKPKSGRFSSCKDCVKARVAERRAENIEYVREYDRARGALQHRKDAVATRAHRYKGKYPASQWRSRNPEKWAAHVKVGNAIRDGKLVRHSRCSKCASAYNVQAHHDDYSKPLDVRWLCQRCHVDHHKAERTAIRLKLTATYQVSQ